jgi:hypothetical protein
LEPADTKPQIINHEKLSVHHVLGLNDPNFPDMEEWMASTIPATLPAQAVDISGQQHKNPKNAVENWTVGFWI